MRMCVREMSICLNVDARPLGDGRDAGGRIGSDQKSNHLTFSTEICLSKLEYLVGPTFCVDENAFSIRYNFRIT